MCRGKIFWKINKRAGWKFSGKSIILQVILIFETEKVIVNFILTCLLSYLSQIQTSEQNCMNLDEYIFNFDATQINVQGEIFSQN